MHVHTSTQTRARSLRRLRGQQGDVMSILQSAHDQEIKRLAGKIAGLEQQLAQLEDQVGVHGRLGTHT